MKFLFFFTHNRSFLRDFFISLSGKLIDSGHKVTVYSYKSQPNQFTLENGVKVRILKKQMKILDYPRAFRIINEEKPDVVISNFSYVNPIVLASRFYKVRKNIVWSHTLLNQLNYSRTNVFIKSKFLNLSSAIIANSKELKEEIQTEYKQPVMKVYNLPFTSSVLEISEKEIELEKQPDTVYVGCPGRICVDKNQKILLDILPDLLKDKNVVMVFVGSNHENLLEQHSNYAKYEHQIKYLGVLSQNEMVSFYKKMDVIVLPSLNEAFGLVFIESLAMGKPTFVSERFGSLYYVKDDYSSFSFNPKKPTELTDKIKAYLKNKKEKSYFENIYYSNFSLEQIYKDFLSVINN